MSTAEQHTSGTVERITTRPTEAGHRDVIADTTPGTEAPPEDAARKQTPAKLSAGAKQAEGSQAAAIQHLLFAVPHDLQHAEQDESSGKPQQVTSEQRQVSATASAGHVANFTTSPFQDVKLEAALPDVDVTVTPLPAWQSELDIVKLHQSHRLQQPSKDASAGHTSQSFPQSLQQATSSSDAAAISGSHPGYSDSRSDNLIPESGMQAQTGLPDLSMLQPASSGATDSAGEGSADESSEKQGECRGAKKPRLVWTAELHSRFMNAVNHLGVKNAVPKSILGLMNVDGMTRENVASHLQKYRLYLKKIGGLTSNAKVTPEALQAIQQQALQQQAREAYQSRLGAIHGIATHTTTQGYFGPTSLTYAPPSGPVFHPGANMPDFQAAGHHPWFTGASPQGQHPGSTLPQQRPSSSPGLDQMASAYGLLQSQGTQAQQQPPGWSWAPAQSGGWGAGGSTTATPYVDPSGCPDPAQYAVPHQSVSSGYEASAQHGQPAGAVPDAMQHLLSAAEAASSERK